MPINPGTEQKLITHPVASSLRLPLQAFPKPSGVRASEHELPILLACCWCLITKQCLTLCDTMGCNPPGSSVHSPVKNTGVGCHFFIQGIFLTQGSNLCLLCLCHWRQVLYHQCHLGSLFLSSVKFSSVTQQCPTLCDPMNCSTPGLLVHQQLPEFTQTHVHQSVMPSNHLILHHPLFLPLSIFPRSGSFPISQFFASGGQSVWSFSFNISPSNEYSGLISFRMDWFDLLAVQWTLKSLLQQHSSKASILRCSAFFLVQLTSIHDYWKNHSLDQMDLCWQSNVSAL